MSSSQVTPASNAFGTIGAVCWSIQLIPQIITNYRRHHTVGLQPSMMLLWATAGVPLGVYNITQSFSIALQIQPQILTLLSLVTWAQCMYYGHKRSLWTCSMWMLLLCLLMGGIETALVFALRTDGASMQRGEWPARLMGALSGLLLCLGVGRHYVDIWKERTVRGVSFLFCGIDALGDVTSLASVLLQRGEIDILGVVVYASELLMWTGVFIAGGWYSLRPWLGSKLRDGVIETSDQVADVNPSRSSSTSSSCFRTASSRVAAHSNEMNILRSRTVVQV